MTTNGESTLVANSPTTNAPLSKSGDAIGSMVSASSHNAPSGAADKNSNTDRVLPTAEGYLTVLSDPVNYHVKHPLQSHWTLHQKIGQVEGATSRGVTQDNWERALVQSVTIGTVEDFWCVYNSMQDVNTIPNNCDYFFMREGVKPMWEDVANKGGCELRVVVTRNMDAMNMWKMALLATVGSQFSEYEVITGAQFAFRATKNRISIWLSAASSETRERLRGEFATVMEKACGADNSGPLRVDINEFDKAEGHGAARTDRRAGGSEHRGGDRGGEHRGGDRGGDRGDRGGDRGDRSSGGGSGGWSRSGSSGAGRGGSSGPSSRSSYSFRDDRYRP